MIRELGQMYALAGIAAIAASFVLSDIGIWPRAFALMVFGVALGSLGFLVSETEVQNDPWEKRQ